MALITTVALAAAVTKNYVGGITPLFASIDVTNLAAAVTNGDRVQIAELPANANVIGLQARLTGASGITGLAEFRLTEPTGNSIPISATNLAPSIALVALLTQPHSPITSVTAVRSLELAVLSGSLSNTTAGQKLIVQAQYAFIGTTAG